MIALITARSCNHAIRKALPEGSTLQSLPARIICRWLHERPFPVRKAVHQGTDTEDETACTREAEAEFGIEFPYTYATYIRK